MTAKTIGFKSLVKLADKGAKPEKDPSYQFGSKTFRENPKPPGKHVQAK